MLSLLPKVVEMKNNQKLWESAMKTAESSGGLNEIAVGNSGELYVKGENDVLYHINQCLSRINFQVFHFDSVIQ